MEILALVLSGLIAPPPLERSVAAVSVWDRVGLLTKRAFLWAMNPDVKMPAVSKPRTNFADPFFVWKFLAERSLDREMNQQAIDFFALGKLLEGLDLQLSEGS